MSSQTSFHDSEITAFSDAKIDWKDTPDAYIFRVDTPRLKKEEVEAVIEEGKILTIRGERNTESFENEKPNRIKRRSSGKFLRSYQLPENAGFNQTNRIENGVFTVTVPKVERKKTAARSIEISG